MDILNYEDKLLAQIDYEFRIERFMGFKVNSIESSLDIKVKGMGRKFHFRNKEVFYAYSKFVLCKANGIE